MSSALILRFAAVLAVAVCAACGNSVLTAPSGQQALCPTVISAASTDRFDEPVQLNSTPSGLRYGDERVGCGALVLPSTAAVQRTLTVDFTAWLDDGRLLGSSHSPGGQPQTFTLGRGQVIPAFEIGFAGMRVGGKRRLVTPPALAFGAAGRPPLIPPNATLVWDVELLNQTTSAGP